MKKFGLATIVSSGMAAVILGVAPAASATTPAEPVDHLLSSANYPAGVDHRTWLDQIGPHVVAPQVNSSVQLSR